METVNAAQVPEVKKRIESFEEFYPLYLAAHSTRWCRRLHFVASGMAVVSIGASIVTLNPMWAVRGIVSGYALAWFSHFVFEKNKPLAWTHPYWSYRADGLMIRDALKGKIPF